jgi:N-acetylglucosamine-6-sulfatase
MLRRPLRTLLAFALAVSFLAPHCLLAQALPKNVVFILSDDHRHDFMGFHPDAPVFLETPHVDRMAEGASTSETHS